MDYFGLFWNTIQPFNCLLHEKKIIFAKFFHNYNVEKVKNFERQFQ